MAGRSVHVVPNGDEWAVEENHRTISAHRSQHEAEAAAREEARRIQGELVIHGRDGRIERRDSEGHDPRNVKG